jgi:hypothetical protein
MLFVPFSRVDTGICRVVAFALLKEAKATRAP